MALTLEQEQKIIKAGLDSLYTSDQQGWLKIVQDCYDYTKKAFHGATIRPDDVFKCLYPSIEVDQKLSKMLSTKKLTQKYWVTYFTNYIIDKTWATIKK